MIIYKITAFNVNKVTMWKMVIVFKEINIVIYPGCNAARPVHLVYTQIQLCMIVY